MIPLAQTKFGKPNGNCFAACLASLLHCAIETVPNPKHSRWLDEINRWLLAEYGCYALNVAMGSSDQVLRGYYIANGMSPRGLQHSVIYRDGRMVHDPHPDRTGIYEPSTFVVLVPMDIHQDIHQQGG